MMRGKGFLLRAVPTALVAPGRPSLSAISP
jgi:hypothetical protein